MEECVRKLESTFEAVTALLQRMQVFWDVTVSLLDP